MPDDTPYRQPPEPAGPPPPPAVEFAWRDARARTNAVLVFQLGAFGVIAVGFAMAVHPAAALGVAAVVVVAGASYLRRPRAETALRVSVAGGVVEVFTGGERLHALPLADLREVELDRREHSAVTLHQEAGAPMMSSQVSAPVDVARIVLVREGGARLRLTETYGSYSESTAAFAKLRVFLRKHGWLPPDER